MKVVTPKQMGEIDYKAINEYGIPGIVLMENAALKVVDEIEKELSNKSIIKKQFVVLIAGKGNNGGDAFAVARHLFNKGIKVKVYITAEEEKISGDAKTNLDILRKMGLDICSLTDKVSPAQLSTDLENADIIVDGILGTGIKGEIRGSIRNVIESVNLLGKKVVSIDIPSGVNGETGKVCGLCIKADKTVTFGLPKTGLIIHPGCEYTGELVIADIGLPRDVIDSFEIKTILSDDEFISKNIPDRPIRSNKGDYGKVFLITGSTGMTGAGALTGNASLKSGTGLVYLGAPKSLLGTYDILVPEAVKIPLLDMGKGTLVKECREQIFKWLKSVNAAAVGPGLSTSNEIAQVVFEVIEKSRIPLVLDADALNCISKDITVLKRLKCEAVLTPHPGEMARLMGTGIKEIQENRIEICREFSARWKVITVLKGAKTVIASPEGNVYINPTGNSGMATGGTGDVLTGIIVSLIGQGIRPFEAAVSGTYIHGMAGDKAADLLGEHGTTAKDVVEQIPGVIKVLYEGNT